MAEKSRGADELEEKSLDEMEQGPAAPGDEKKSKGVEDSGDSGKKKNEGSKVTVQMDEDVARRLRSAVYYTPGLTMWEVVEKGTEIILDRLAEKRGEEFPDFGGQLEGGRPPQDVPKLDLEDI